MELIAIVLLAGVALVVGVLLFWSPGEVEPIVDGTGTPVAGSISEKIHVPINGVDQGMFIKSRDPSNPVLLFVHGGPGMTGYFLNDDYPTGLENDFTTVWWDQRGAGLSYSGSIPAESMTVDQFVDDTIAVTNYLRERFEVDKIYLMAHSWGSFIGIQAAAKAPELYHAYIGVAQVSYQLESERRSYEYMVERYRELGDTKMVHRLEATDFSTTVPLPKAYDAIRDEAMHRLGVGTTHDMESVIWGVFVPSLQSREYTLQEKWHMWRGRAFSRSTGLHNDLLSTDLRKRITGLEIPVHFIHGAHDQTVSLPIAQEFLGNLTAPVKGFYIFPQSAHSPVYEEPALAREILRENILARSTALTDGS